MPGSSRRIVVDASVAVKWFVPERGQEKALRLHEKYLDGEVEVYAPSLIVYEVSNALRFHRVYRLEAEMVASAVESLLDLGIARDLDAKAWRLAIKLSYDHNVTIYDAAYASLAVLTGSTLATSDKELYNKLGNVLDVTLLDNLRV